MDLIIAACVGAILGALIGPPIGLWLVRFEHAVDRHRAHCPSCQARAERRAQRTAA